MNNKEFIAELARATNMKAQDAQKLVNAMLDAMGDQFMEGNAVQLANLGAFEVKKKMERVIVNPTTGQRMLVPPKLTLAFKPNNTLRDKIKKGGTGNG
ncbi:MAG: HU family DNA-binding protein [Prevotella sp.]|nr:HU family DNA-binding protein [Prevotella sp.]